MSLHTAKAHFSNALNYASSQYEKELVHGLIAMVTALRDNRNETDNKLRAIEHAIQNFKNRQ
ncbi:MAG: hypothetical protein R3200_04100 [Xanthomonadales bacterium]|nr:hypothetical protein [Xanthomonadales bacterium]